MRTVPILFLLLTVVLVGVWVIQADAPTRTEAVSALEAVPATNVGMRVAIDPSTGRFTEDPAYFVDPVTNPLNWSDEGLVQEKSPVSGIMINLQGRYQNTFVASVDESGNVTAECNEQTDNSEGE